MAMHRNLIQLIDPEVIYDTVTKSKFRFWLVFVVSLLLSYGLLYSIDFLPESPDSQSSGRVSAAGVESDAGPETNTDISVNTETSRAGEFGEQTNSRPDVSDQTKEVSAVLPVRMHIDALERDIPILNPTSRSIVDLDAALQEGAVRHPDAADFQQEGNIFVLGHSSYLPNVWNQNFQIFNGIEKLQWGDVIRVYSEDSEYIYQVSRVYKAKASALTVPIADTGARLTLATCNSFGSIDDRFIVEAELKSKRPL